MNFGSFSGENLDLSIILVYLVVLVLINIPAIWNARRILLKNKTVWLGGLICLWASLTILWGMNLFKGVMIAGVLWLILGAFLTFLSNAKIHKLLPSLFRIFILSAVLWTIFGIVQVVLNATGVYYTGLWLCEGCRAEMFGFARATGAFIEPQFFGGILAMAALLILGVWVSAKDRAKWLFSKNWINMLVLGLLVFGLVLTLSRGAIFGFTLGCAVLIVLNWRRWRKILIGAGTTLFAVVACILAQGGLAAMNPNVEISVYRAISTSLNQLSLGVINLPANEEKTVEVSSESQGPIFDGYVEESTGIRTMLSRLAWESWTANSKNFLVGIGTGSTGFYFHEHFPEREGRSGTGEIVQNQYLENVLEWGLVGGILTVAGVLILFIKTWSKKTAFWPVIICILITICFFSGYPNALHIYLLLGVLIIASSTQINLKHKK
jgi:hypothetical protein